MISLLMGLGIGLGSIAVIGIGSYVGLTLSDESLTD